MKKYTTKIVYVAGNSFGDQYTDRNCNDYGTKWKTRLSHDTNYGTYEIVGTPKLLEANWTIDEKKVQQTNEELNKMLGY